MYQDIPCICQNYSIDWVEEAGYDVATLLPRRIKVNMKLEELRAGNFGEFKGVNAIIQRDNLAGWEAVVEGAMSGPDATPTIRQSMDPGYLS